MNNFIKNLIELLKKDFNKISLIIILSIISCSLYAIYQVNNCKSTECNPFAVLGTMGDFIGGILNPLLGIISVALLYKTFSSERKQYEENKIYNEKQLFNSQFFELLNFNSVLLEKTTNLRKGKVNEQSSKYEDIDFIVDILKSEYKKRKFLLNIFLINYINHIIILILLILEIYLI